MKGILCYSAFAFYWVIVVVLTNASAPQWRPVVLMHGIMANAPSMNPVAGWIKDDFPGVYVHSVEIGNGNDDSIFMNMNQQVEVFAKVVQNDPNLKQGFNLIGYSQGGLIARAYIERHNNPPVHNFLSWLGPQDGVYGVPEFNAFCPDKNCPWFNALFDGLMGGGSPTRFLQEHFSFASYWKHPYHYDEYLKDNIFLADINNEKAVKNATYKKQIVSLNAMMLMYSTLDTIVIPSKSPWFDFYAPNSTTLVPYNQSQQYQGDWIGLRTLNTAGKLFFTTAGCKHQDIPDDSCRKWYELNSRSFLNNTL